MHKIQHFRRTQAVCENRKMNEIVCIRCSFDGYRPLATIIKESKCVTVGRSSGQFRWIQSIIILILKINENQTEFGNRRLSDNADHLFQSQMEHSVAKPNEHASYFHASLTISQSKWSDKSAAGAPDLTCIGFGKISKDLL